MVRSFPTSARLRPTSMVPNPTHLPELGRGSIEHLLRHPSAHGRDLDDGRGGGGAGRPPPFRRGQPCPSEDVTAQHPAPPRADRAHFVRPDPGDVDHHRVALGGRHVELFASGHPAQADRRGSLHHSPTTPSSIPPHLHHLLPPTPHRQP